MRIDPLMNTYLSKLEHGLNLQKLRKNIFFITRQLPAD